MLQTCLEVWGAVAREDRLVDRALEFTLRRKTNLYSNERRAVAERVMLLTRKLRTATWALEQEYSGFRALGSTEQDSLLLCAARVIDGEDPGAVATSAALTLDRAAILGRLHRAIARLDTLPPVQRLAIGESLPDFLAEQFLAEFGDQALPLARAMNARAPLTARVNALKATREWLQQRLEVEGVRSTPTPLSDLGLQLDGRLNAFSLPSFKEGLFELQDEGSQLLGMLVDAPPTKVVDACAGAGGKALQLAAQMKNRGDLFALDVDARRLEELKKRARRDGVHNVRTRPIAAGDDALEALQDLVGQAHRVLVDAPCSGTGTFRRKPDARYRLTPQLLEDHIARQKVLLRRFSALVRPGGRLIYGTCSVLRAENEAVIEDFLAGAPDFKKVDASQWLPEPARSAVRDGYLRLFPHLHGTDGFFGAVLERARA